MKNHNIRNIKLFILIYIYRDKSMKMFYKIVDFINHLDFLNIFGFFPTMTIQKKDCYKSPLSAFVFLLYSIFFFIFLIPSLVDYINSINDVDKIKNIFFKSDKYTLDANDFYFGIGLSGLNNSNLTNLSFFEFGLKYKNVDEYGNITSSKILPLLPCQPRYFFTRKDWEETDLDKRSFLNNSMKTYLSQDLNYSADLIPFQYKEEYSYVELYIKAQDKYQVKNALSFINTYKPKIEFVWSAISIH
jgi:hypothetical protein